MFIQQANKRVTIFYNVFHMLHQCEALHAARLVRGSIPLQVDPRTIKKKEGLPLPRILDVSFFFHAVIIGTSVYNDVI